MKFDKDHAILLDIQYVKENRSKGLPDYLYIIWKDTRTGEVSMNPIPNPQVDVYFEKPEYRNHTFNKTEELKEHLYKKRVKYKDMIFEVAKEDGPQMQQFVNSCFATRNYRDLGRVNLSRYAFGHDYDIRVLYRNEWLNKYDNSNERILTKAFADIEVDGLECKGTPDYHKCPVDMITIIDTEMKEVYTFALVGVKCVEKDTSRMGPDQVREEYERRAMYEHRLEEQAYWMNHRVELLEEAHKMFDENYPGYNFNVYFYEDEAKMLVHFFQCVHKIRANFLMFWNIAFDIPYMMGRIKYLGMDPAEVICHPDFPNKECLFKRDNFHFQIKNKTDFFRVSDYTIYADQMINYAAIRKSQSELRRVALTYIAQKEIEDEKLDYSEEATIKTLSYRNWLKYYLYNIKDVFLQVGIEEKTTDVETLYVYSYENITPYENVFKQTVKLRCLQYRYWEKQGMVPGANVNAFVHDGEEEPEEEDEEDIFDDEYEEKKKKKDVNYEGALVADPTLNQSFGIMIYGKRANNAFRYSIDMDMSAFYPNTVCAMNIYPACLLYKMILQATQYNVRGGEIPFNGITDVQLNKNNSNSFCGDIAKECMDNYVTGNIISFAHKWMNFPSVQDVYKRIQSV